MRRTGVLREHPFLAVRKRRPRQCDRPERVVPLVIPAVSNQERSLLLVLTVLLLLTGAYQAEGGMASEREDGTSGVGLEVTLSGSPVKSVGGNVGGIPVSVAKIYPSALQKLYLQLN